MRACGKQLPFCEVIAKQPMESRNVIGDEHSHFSFCAAGNGLRLILPCGFAGKWIANHLLDLSSRPGS